MGAGGGIEIHWAPVPAGRLDESTRAALAADLDETRLAKLQRFHRQADRDRGLAAHALLRRVLAEVVGGKPAEVPFGYRCAGCGSIQHGKPYLPGREVEFNLSHSQDRVVVALAPAGVAVGVDVEGRRDVDWVALRRSVFGDGEWLRTERSGEPDVERARLWSRKEASIKASGHGLTMPMRSVEIEPLEVEPAAVTSWTARLAGDAGAVTGWDLELDAEPEGEPYAAAVGVMVTGPGVDAEAARAALLAGFVVRQHPLG